MFEYRVIEAPAPLRRGWFGKTPSYAETLSNIINENALDSWEYQRAETDLSSKAKLLIFRKPIKKASEEMGEPKRFSDRLLEAENKSKGKEQREYGQDYAGPVRPRRARVLLDQAGTITERPDTMDSDTIDLDAGAYETNSAAERVTPFKPKAAAAANG